MSALKQLSRQAHATGVATRRHRAPLRVQAVASRDPESSPAPQPVSPQPAAVGKEALQLGWSKFMQRYEQPMLSSGVGAAVVTTWCMAHGQDPGTAAAITVAATISALVLNEVLFSEN